MRRWRSSYWCILGLVLFLGLTLLNVHYFLANLATVYAAMDALVPGYSLTTGEAAALEKAVREHRSILSEIIWFILRELALTALVGGSLALLTARESHKVKQEAADRSKRD